MSFVPTFALSEATRVETWPTITGVASPRVNTASAAHEMIEPTSCAMTSLTRSWTTWTIVDAIVSPVDIAPAQVPAAPMCAAASVWKRR